MKFLCKIGWHKWEETPFYRDIVKGTGHNFLFWSWGVQKGERQCLSCGIYQKCWREGWCGSGVAEMKWKKMSASKEAYIDNLPNVFQS
jgi:hypothetical protein